MKVKVLGLLALGLAASMAANAQSETLFYTGNNLTDITADGPLGVSGNISGYITLDAPLAGSLSSVFVTPSSFSFSGGLSSALGSSEFFAFSTNAIGTITDWEFGLSGTNGSNPAVTVSEGSLSSSGIGFDVTSLDYIGQDGIEHQPSGSVSTPGTWTVATVAAPEIDPTSAVSGLMLLLGGVAVLRGRTKVRVS